jgi:hypothetical protein
MNEDALTQAVAALADDLGKATQQMMSMAERIKPHVEAYEELARVIAAQAAAVPAEDIQLVADRLVAELSRPLALALADATEGFAAVSFDFSVAAQGDASEQGGVGLVATSAMEVAGEIDAASQNAAAAFLEARTRIDDAVSSLVNQAKDYGQQARSAMDRYKDSLDRGIPDLATLVGDLLDDAVTSKLRALTEAIFAVLERLESMVEAVTGELTQALGGVSSILEEINAIVRPFEPAFDAFEATLG